MCKFPEQGWNPFIAVTRATAVTMPILNSLKHREVLIDKIMLYDIYIIKMLLI